MSETESQIKDLSKKRDDKISTNDQIENDISLNSGLDRIEEVFGIYYQFISPVLKV